MHTSFFAGMGHAERRTSKRRGGGGGRPKPTQVAPQTAPSGAAWGSLRAPFEQILPPGGVAVGTCDWM